MTKFYTILLLLIFLFSCTNKRKEAELEDRLAKLEKDNKELQDKLNFTTEAPVEEQQIPESTIAENNYVFVKLVVEQEEPKFGSPETDYKQSVTYNYCSEILKLASFDSELKYTLMDDVQQNYYRSKGQFYNGKVKSRECFVFSSYEEASKKREEYLMGL
jgi:hypothetical protein